MHVGWPCLLWLSCLPGPGLRLPASVQPCLPPAALACHSTATPHRCTLNSNLALSYSQPQTCIVPLQHLGVMPEPLHQATIGGVPVPQEGGAAEHRGESSQAEHGLDALCEHGRLCCPGRPSWRDLCQPRPDRQVRCCVPVSLSSLLLPFPLTSPLPLPPRRAAEARRLAHVAATRARRRHFISYPCKMVSKRGWPYEVQPSSFLEGVLERYRDTPTLELELAN